MRSSYITLRLKIYANEVLLDMEQSQAKQVKQTTQKDGKIRFALAGGSGTGKSAFINAIRG